MRLRLLEPDGQEAFRRDLRMARDGDIDRDELGYRVERLRLSGLPLDCAIPDGEKHFVDRVQLGQHLVDVLAVVEPQALSRPGFWTWLTTAYFDIICPGSPTNDDRRYILSESPRHHYRHLLYGPYSVAREHAGNVRGLGVLLSGPPDRPGEFWEQVASRQALIASPVVVDALGRLYYDAERGGPVSGAASKGPGSARRFVDLIAQLDCTWDLWEVPPQSLLDMLPREFAPFLRGAHE